MIKKSPKRPDILRWIPSRWDQFAGNESAIRRFKRLTRSIRKSVEDGNADEIGSYGFLLSGASRSGKTALAKFLVRCIACHELDQETLNPCDGSCIACRHRPEMAGLNGLWSRLVASETGAKTLVHFTPIDCTLISGRHELQSRLREMSSEFDGLRVLYFDEVHRLTREGMDEMLLKAVEERRALWIFSTAMPDGLEPMFTNRLIKISTQVPTQEEMASWLLSRCVEWDIMAEDAAIVRVVQKSNCVVGTALHALALAAIELDGLTLDLVENDWTPERPKS